jgi:hypothetical protein
MKVPDQTILQSLAKGVTILMKTFFFSLVPLSENPTKGVTSDENINRKNLNG